jgi:hypothetical protein
MVTADSGIDLLCLSSSNNYFVLISISSTAEDRSLQQITVLVGEGGIASASYVACRIETD